ncbi:hypothetical protein H9L39_03871 [Fusarium oxysporum f. sp. albedinis]|nr:hypothetical protein H9L39_03871 [Fusarium oxysporum f. sp. albedinis]
MPALLHIVSKYLGPTSQVPNLGIVRDSFLGPLSLAFAINSGFSQFLVTLDEHYIALKEVTSNVNMRIEIYR